MTVSEIGIGHLFRQGGSVYVRLESEQARHLFPPVPMVFAVRLLGGRCGQIIAMKMDERVDGLVKHVHIDETPVSERVLEKPIWQK